MGCNSSGIAMMNFLVAKSDSISSGKPIVVVLLKRFLFQPAPSTPTNTGFYPTLVADPNWAIILIGIFAFSVAYFVRITRAWSGIAKALFVEDRHFVLNSLNPCFPATDDKQSCHIDKVIASQQDPRIYISLEQHPKFRP